MVFLFSVSVYAGDKQWSSGGDGSSWADASNWFPDAIPTASDNVSIDTEDADVTASETFSAQSLTIGGREESAFTTADFVYGKIAPDDSTQEALYIRKDGAVTLAGPGTITLEGAFKNSQEALSSEPAFMFGIE